MLTTLPSFTGLPTTHARRSEDGQRWGLKAVVFRVIFDSTIKASYDVHVHWHYAFAFLRAYGGSVEVSGVVLTDDNGREYESYAKWIRPADWKNGGYQDNYIITSLSGRYLLVEHDGVRCPCAYEPPAPHACALHPQAAAAAESPTT